MKSLKVSNIINQSGNIIKNQFFIYTDDGVYFQSYKSVIAFIPRSGPTILDINKWDYSKTTSKYLYIFLNMNRVEVHSKIKSGIFILADLN